MLSVIAHHRVWALLPAGVLLSGGCAADESGRSTQVSPTRDGAPVALSSEPAPESAKGVVARGLRVVWERECGAGEYWYTLSSVAVGVEGEIVMAAIALDSQASPPENHVLLWRIDKTGTVIDTLKIAKPAVDGRGQALDVSLSEGVQVQVLPNGEMVLAIGFVEGRPWLVRLDRHGRQLMSKELLGPDRRVTIKKMVPRSNGHFVLLGHERLDTFAMEVDALGNVVWENIRDRGEMDFAVDGVSTDDGGFVVIENSGQYNMLGVGPSSVWVSKYDARWALQRELRLEGRHGRVTNTPGGRIALVYNRSTSVDQDIYVETFDRSLERVSQTRVLQSQQGLSPFSVGSCPGSGCIVGGGKHDKLFLCRMDDNGNVVWRFWGEQMPQSIDYELLLEGDNIFVASSVFAKGEGGYHKVVKLVKFSEE
ncbi:MAG: hypothetical protein V3W34_19260 [Phycisphaerae bacterium]